MIKNGYTDIHSHVLFGVDDGAESLEMSLQMIRKAYDEGIRVQYATPHFSVNRHRSWREKTEGNFEILKKAAAEKFPDYELYLGSELYYEPGMLDALKCGRALTMNGSRYVLVEFAFGGPYDYMYQSIRELTASRYKPILAHTERFSCLQGRMDLIEELRSLGVIIQINSEIFDSSRFSSAYRNGMRLIREGLADCIATDAHDLKKRAPRMQKAMEIITHKYGEVKLLKEFRF